MPWEPSGDARGLRGGASGGVAAWPGAAIRRGADRRRPGKTWRKTRGKPWKSWENLGKPWENGGFMGFDEKLGDNLGEVLETIDEYG